MEKIRVLHCLETVDSGGVEQRRLILARQLDGTHYEQALVCTDAEGALPARFAEAGCPLHTVGEFRGVLDREPYRRTLEVVRTFRPHIIHGAVFEGVSLATIIGRLAGVPVIVGEETSDPVNRRWRLAHHGHSYAAQRFMVIMTVVKPTLCVADAIICGEGDGPIANLPRFCGCVLETAKSAESFFFGLREWKRRFHGHWATAGSGFA